jgi:hypothetical protein
MGRYQPRWKTRALTNIQAEQQLEREQRRAEIRAITPLPDQADPDNTRSAPQRQLFRSIDPPQCAVVLSQP